ncbi:MAG TPA: preprotein translocase subunit SecG [Gemmatimonadaceae bacterium]|nr:preprotein translocase subunit SecG [Gemmatimonadaceae bacterium]
MYTFLLVLLVLDCFVLVAAVLLQSPKGGGLAATFGGTSSSSDSIIGSRQAANLLTKTAWWTGGLFLGIAFIMQLIGQRSGAPRSVLDQPFSQQAAPTAPATGTSAPALPLQPAAPVSKTPSSQPPASQPKKP